MGHTTSHEALALRWAELCADPILRDLPYKIELNAWGKIEMSPASNRHARLQGAVALDLGRQLPAGNVLTESPIATDIGVRVPDVAWASNEFTQRHGDTTPFAQAPEICVEVRSPSNSDDECPQAAALQRPPPEGVKETSGGRAFPCEMEAKTRSYLAAGAVEVWIVSEAGTLHVFDTSGARAASRYPVHLNLPPPAGGGA